MSHKTKFSTDDELYSSIAEQSNKVKFLTETVKLIKADSPLPAYIESNLIDYGYLDLVERIKTASRMAILVIMEEQLEIEKNLLHDLTGLLK